jgi:hypothetical protein
MKSKPCTVAVCLLAAAAVTGCASHVLRNSFEDYDEAYAEAENHQMLLNLARLSEHQPSYFFQLGNINALYEFTGSATVGGGQSDHSAVVLPGHGTGLTSVASVPLINWLFGPANATGTASSKPTFQFVPLSGGDFAAHLITPLPTAMFHSVFRDGFPVDILMRAMVQQISLSEGTNEIVLHNIPTRENETNYESFLRLCGILRDLQEHGYLMERLVPQSDTNSFPEMTAEPTAKDLMDAFDKGMNWKSENGKWHLEKESAATNILSFELTPGPDARDYLESFKSRAPYNNTEREGAKMIDRLGLVLDKSRSGGGKLESEVQLRSFLFVLANMANEDAAFKILERDPAFCAAYIPPSELRPVLKMDWSHETNLVSLCRPVAKVKYEGKEYEIADEKHADGTCSTFNRDAFSLATILITQISIDPTKLNYQPQLLQVR